jgi:Asp-tRNA(Asn)/Glu-tRNA(Gln) amidotransferase A subunit family amidase
VTAARGASQPPGEPAISKDTLACAGDVSGLSFSDAERELMRQAVSTNREHFETLRRVPLAMDVEPALSFRVPASAAAGLPPPKRPAPPRRTAPGARPAPLAREAWPFASIEELAAQVRARRLTSRDLVALSLERLARFDPTLHCVVTLTPEVALAQAAEADRELAAGRSRGPLHGLPFGLKDLVATRGIRTTWGAAPFEHQVPDEDATVYTRLREAGAVLVAKLSTGELAGGDLWFGGRTRNPWDPERGSSGSSAGPAAATAAGLVAFAIGTETNGSIISPASTCGVTGLRPTYGRVSRHGVMILRWSMDKVGVLARSAADTAHVLAAIYGPDGQDETVADVAFDWRLAESLDGLRIGLIEQDLQPRRSTATEDDRARWAERVGLVRQAVATLERAGARVSTVTLPDLPARAMYAVCNAEAGSAFDDLVRSGAVARLAEQGPGGRANQLRGARFIPAVEYLRAQRIRTRLIAEIQALFSGVDVLVGPTDSESITMTNFTGHPALCMNAGFARELPVGLLLVGRYYDEATLVRVAGAFQQRSDWHRRHPQAFAGSV